MALVMLHLRLTTGYNDSIQLLKLCALTVTDPVFKARGRNLAVLCNECHYLKLFGAMNVTDMRTLYLLPDARKPSCQLTQVSATCHLRYECYVPYFA